MSRCSSRCSSRAGRAAARPIRRPRRARPASRRPRWRSRRSARASRQTGERGQQGRHASRGPRSSPRSRRSAAMCTAMLMEGKVAPGACATLRPCRVATRPSTRARTCAGAARRPSTRARREAARRGRRLRLTRRRCSAHSRRLWVWARRGEVSMNIQFSSRRCHNRSTPRQLAMATRVRWRCGQGGAVTAAAPASMTASMASVRASLPHQCGAKCAVCAPHALTVSCTGNVGLRVERAARAWPLADRSSCVGSARRGRSWRAGVGGDCE